MRRSIRMAFVCLLVALIVYQPALACRSCGGWGSGRSMPVYYSHGPIVYSGGYGACDGCSGCGTVVYDSGCGPCGSRSSSGCSSCGESSSSRGCSSCGESEAVTSDKAPAAPSEVMEAPASSPPTTTAAPPSEPPTVVPPAQPAELNPAPELPPAPPAVIPPAPAEPVTPPAESLFGTEPEPMPPAATPLEAPPAATPPATPPAATPPAEKAADDDLFGGTPETTPAAPPAAPPAATPPAASPSDDLFGPSTPEPPTSGGTTTTTQKPAETPAATEAMPEETPATAPSAEEKSEPADAEKKDEKPKTEETDPLFGAVPNALLEAGGLASEEMRMWTDNTGNFSCRGRLVRFHEGQVRLLKENGRTATVPFARLSTGDLEFVNRQASAQRAEIGKTAQSPTMIPSFAN